MDENDDNILSCLQEPALGKDSHLIPDAIQEVTSPLSKEDKDKVFLREEQPLRQLLLTLLVRKPLRQFHTFMIMQAPKLRRMKIL